MVLSPTLSMYKSLLKFARRLPKDKRADSIDRIRNEFRQHSNVHDAKRIEELLKHAQSTLGYLKIVTPRRSYEQQGVTKVVFGDLSAPKKAVSNWTGSNMDPDAVRRHYQGLKRAGFKDNKSVTGGMF